ncbi:MAG: hypothetical protein KIT33_03685 [Candidatus Kapabacteria bacterium]|nr:hypothetical protein [Ignavibacteriota bacterium]MCW5884054.1 hypothetical protein [Candidatus Kapabacteria bacterium]
MSYTTIKIPTQIHKKLKQLSIESKFSQQEVLEKSLQKYETDLFWEECTLAYSKLVNDEGDDDFSGTIGDGLDDEY